MRIRLALLLAVAVAVLSGCSGYTYQGSVDVAFATSGGSYDAGTWHYEAVNPNLVVAVQLTEVGDARVEEVWWTPVSWPVSPPALSDPYSTTTTMTFFSSGTHVLDFHVRYRVGADLVTEVHPVEVVVLPSGAA